MMRRQEVAMPAEQPSTKRFKTEDVVGEHSEYSQQRPGSIQRERSVPEDNSQEDSQSQFTNNQPADTAGGGPPATRETRFTSRLSIDDTISRYTDEPDLGKKKSPVSAPPAVLTNTCTHMHVHAHML